jgi:RNA 3'-terminal phosphate cyclase (ATP)
VARLPRHIAEREIDVIRSSLAISDDQLSVEEIRNSAGPGNIAILSVESDALTETFAGFGRRGVPAEAVARGLVSEAKEYLAADVPVGRRLADQLLVPMALAGGGRFRTLPPSRHTRTNARVIRRFLDVDIAIEPEGDDNGAWQVVIKRRSSRPGAPDRA